MQFDKPKVTIDLEEYQHLKDRVYGMDTDEMLLAAKEIIAALAMGNNYLGQAMEYLKEKNIAFTVLSSERNFRLGNRLTAEDICISKIKPNNG